MLAAIVSLSMELKHLIQYVLYIFSESCKSETTNTAY